MIDEIPEDVYEEIMEAMKELKGEKRRRRLRQPSNTDIMNAIRHIVKDPTLKPPELYERVIDHLEENGFNTRYINERRVWRLYEYLVRKRIIHDYLGVVE